MSGTRGADPARPVAGNRVAVPRLSRSALPIRALVPAGSNCPRGRQGLGVQAADPPSTSLFGGWDAPGLHQLANPGPAQPQHKCGFREAEPDFTVVWGPSGGCPWP